MSEKELLQLGFTKEFGDDVIEDEPGFYYYVKEITNGLTFITNGNDYISKLIAWFFNISD